MTSAQFSNITITTNQFAVATLTFTVSGQSGTLGFSNMTLPKTAIPDRIIPTIYIDGQTALEQDNRQDDLNLYVWFTAHFSTHEVSLIFTSQAIMPPPLTMQ